jgi:hypothetical protein
MANREFNIVAVLSSNVSDFNSGMRSAQRSSSSLGDSIKETFKSMISPAGLATAAIGALSAAVVTGVQDQIQLAKELEDASNSFKQYGTAVDFASKATNNMARAVAKVSGTAIDDVTKTVNALAKAYGVTLNEAMEKYNDLVFDGIKNTGDINQQLQEYSGLLADAGISMEQFLGLVRGGISAGVFDDKAVDVMKEVVISLSEMNDKTVEAISSLSTAEGIFSAIDLGDYHEAFKLIAKGLSDIELPATTAYTVVQGLGKSLGEDIGVKTFIQILNSDLEDVNDNLEFTIEQYEYLTEVLKTGQELGFFSKEAKSARKFRTGLRDSVDDVIALIKQWDLLLDSQKESAEGQELYNKIAKQHTAIMSVRNRNTELFNELIHEGSRNFLAQSEVINKIEGQQLGIRIAEGNAAKEKRRADEADRKRQNERLENEKKINSEKEEAARIAKEEKKILDGKLKADKIISTLGEDSLYAQRERKAALEKERDYLSDRLLSLTAGTAEYGLTQDLLIKNNKELDLTVSKIKAITDSMKKANTESVVEYPEGSYGALTQELHKARKELALMVPESEEAIAQFEKIEDLEIEIGIKTEEPAKKLNDVLQDWLADYGTFVQGIESSIRSVLDSVESRMLNAKKRDLKAAGDNAKKREEIERKYFYKQKKMRIAEANMNIAASILQAFASSAPPYSYILAGIAGAAGAVQLATIQSEQFANGGIVYGETLATVGEYAGARNNPEVIAPLNKLKNILREDGMGVTGDVRFEIEYDKLVGVLGNGTRKQKTFK